MEPPIRPVTPADAVLVVVVGDADAFGAALCAHGAYLVMQAVTSGHAEPVRIVSRPSAGPRSARRVPGEWGFGLWASGIGQPAHRPIRPPWPPWAKASQSPTPNAQSPTGMALTAQSRQTARHEPNPSSSQAAPPRRRRPRRADRSRRAARAGPNRSVGRALPEARAGARRLPVGREATPLPRRDRPAAARRSTGGIRRPHHRRGLVAARRLRHGARAREARPGAPAEDARRVHRLQRQHDDPRATRGARRRLVPRPASGRRLPARDRRVTPPRALRRGAGGGGTAAQPRPAAARAHRWPRRGAAHRRQPLARRIALRLARFDQREGPHPVPGGRGRAGVSRGPHAPPARARGRRRGRARPRLRPLHRGDRRRAASRRRRAARVRRAPARARRARPAVRSHRAQLHHPGQRPRRPRRRRRVALDRGIRRERRDERMARIAQV